MTLRQTIQAAPAKVNELIDKLSNTSNQAVKTRESLFAELSGELSRYVELEEQHFLPVLRKHPETKTLAAGALKGNKELRARLLELEETPKDNDAFLAKVVELKKGFQEQVRSERKELLPAVLKALSEDEAQELAENMEGAVEEAEKAKRDGKREEAAQSKREQDEADRAEEEKRAGVRAAKAAERMGRAAADEAAETLNRTAESAQDGARRITEGVAQQTVKAASSMRDALTSARATSDTVAMDARAIAASNTIAAKAVSDMGSVWIDWARKTAALNADAYRRLVQSKSVGELAEAQRDLVSGAVRTWMEASTAALQITQQASKQAVNPLQNRLNEAA